MASRIISVTFETETQSRPGAFTVPKAAANLLGVGDDDPVELRVTWEGPRLELSTQLRSGLEVYPRSSDETTNGLESIPPKTPITVTVSRPGEGRLDDDGDAAWTDDRFDAVFAASGGPDDLLARLRDWANDHTVVLRYGNGESSGPLHFDAPDGPPRITLFNVSATGPIEWVFRNNLDRSRGFASRTTRVELVRRLGELFDVDRPDERADTWFGVPAAGLAVPPTKTSSAPAGRRARTHPPEPLRSASAVSTALHPNPRAV